MGPLMRVVEAVCGKPVELPPQLAEQYPELRDAHYRTGGLPLRVGGWTLGASTVSGLTLWRTIWVTPGAECRAELLLHEIRHVQQFQASVSFPVRYIWESLVRGYYDNRYEVDARGYAAARLGRSGTSPTQDV